MNYVLFTKNILNKKGIWAKLKEATGFEPVTYWSAVNCSTAELSLHGLKEETY